MERSTMLVMSALAGLAQGAHASDIPNDSRDLLTRSEVVEVAHIYFNVATGEKVVTLLHDDAQRPVDTGSSEVVWSQTVGNPCLAQGFSSSFFFAPDDLSMVDSMGNPMSTLALESEIADWGDLPFDTVIDCIQVHWITGHLDTDTDNDSFADGISGLAAAWTMLGMYNGNTPGDRCIGAGIIGFGFYDLPGIPPSFTGTFGQYTVDVDLSSAGSLATDLTFELGDTDSDFQGASLGVLASDGDLDLDSNGFPDRDNDGDGLADWGWIVQFIQPGRRDVDNADGDSDSLTGIDGDFADAAPIGISTAALDGGTAVEIAPGEWIWDDQNDNLETEDEFTRYTGYDFNGIPRGTNAGPLDFGGFFCSSDPEMYRPFAGFSIVLYGPEGILPDCPSDITGDGVFDFFDLSFLLQNMVDFNGDTAFDFFDISGILMSVDVGCYE